MQVTLMTIPKETSTFLTEQSETEVLMNIELLSIAVSKLDETSPLKRYASRLQSQLGDAWNLNKRIKRIDDALPRK